MVVVLSEILIMFCGVIRGCGVILGCDDMTVVLLLAVMIWW